MTLMTLIYFKIIPKSNYTENQAVLNIKANTTDYNIHLKFLKIIN